MSNLRRSKRSILGRARVEEILHPFFDDLIGSTNDGKAHYDTFTPTQLLPLRKRTMANMLNDAIVKAALRRLDGSPGVAIDYKYETNFFVFRGEIGLRFKKVARKDRTNNVRTHRQSDLDFHSTSLAGVESPTVVTFAYSLNSTWKEIVRMRVICKWGSETLWTIRLIEGAQAASLPFPHVSHDEHEGPSVRSTRQKREEESGGNG